MHSPPGTASLLDEPAFWTEVTRVASSVAGSERPRRPKTFRLDVRSGVAVTAALVQGDSPSSAVVVVLAADEGFPRSDQIRRRFGMTKRESEVALLLARRLTTKEIARDLGVTDHTALRHTEKVLAKLGIGSRRYVAEKLREGVQGS